jgi:hypothetical protein
MYVARLRMYVCTRVCVYVCVCLRVYLCVCVSFFLSVVVGINANALSKIAHRIQHPRLLYLTL